MSKVESHCLACATVDGPFVGSLCEMCAPWLHLKHYDSPDLKVWVRLYAIDGTEVITMSTRNCSLSYRAHECCVMVEDLVLINGTEENWISPRQVTKVSGLPEAIFNTDRCVFDHDAQLIVKPSESITYHWGERGVVGTPWLQD